MGRLPQLFEGPGTGGPDTSGIAVRILRADEQYDAGADRSAPAGHPWFGRSPTPAIPRILELGAPGNEATQVLRMPYPGDVLELAPLYS